MAERERRSNRLVDAGPPSGARRTGPASRSDRARPRVEGASIDLDGGEWFVLSLPSVSECLPDELTAAERDVAALVLEGMSNGEIAGLRGVSVRTVANQVASVFRKLGVTGRVDLGQALFGRG